MDKEFCVAAQVGCEKYRPLYAVDWPDVVHFLISPPSLMWYVFAANHVEAQALFQGGLLKGCCRKRWWCIC